MDRQDKPHTHQDKSAAGELHSGLRLFLILMGTVRPGLFCLRCPLSPQLAGLAISSAETLKLVSVFGPKLVAIATSAASRPRAISMRPMRGVLNRASKMCPLATKISLEPTGKIHRRIHRRYADVAEIARAVARRYIHAAAERDRQ
jgi:hypothetical protein